MSSSHSKKIIEILKEVSVIESIEVGNDAFKDYVLHRLEFEKVADLIDSLYESEMRDLHDLVSIKERMYTGMKNKYEIIKGELQQLKEKIESDEN
jgi:hypothetical protein